MTFRFNVCSVMIAALALASCGGGGGTSGTVPTGSTPGTSGQTAVMSDAQAQPLENEAQSADTNAEQHDEGAVLPRLTRQTTIGSTVDPMNGDQEPYGLDIAKVDAAPLQSGDLIICNFKDAGGKEGNGTTIEALHPSAGSSPTRVAQDPSLKGCAAVALSVSDTIWAAAFVANDNPIVRPNGTIVTTLPGGPWHGPFGQIFSPMKGPFGNAAFYESNAADGSIVRTNITEKGFTFDVIATGFAINHGAPGGILGPSGLQYDAKRDRLFIVDGADNSNGCCGSLTVFNFVSRIPAGGVTVENGHFGGIAGRLAKRIFAGPPLNAPISSALLANGHLVLGNTGLATASSSPTPNLFVEITRGGRVLATKNVDTGGNGAIFGMIATGTSDNTKIYFGDDNSNTVQLVSE